MAVKATKKNTKKTIKKSVKTARPAASKPAARKVAKKAAAPSRALPRRKPEFSKSVSKPAPKATRAASARRFTKPVAVVEMGDGAAKIRTPFSKKELEQYRKQLLNLRDRIVDEIAFLAGENLNSNQREASGDLSNYGHHMADSGTDSFDREFALSLVSNEQEVLYEIDEALDRIEKGTYGVCEMTGKAIEVQRLKVLPYARYSLEAQESTERNRRRFRSFATPAQIPPGMGGGGDY